MALENNKKFTNLLQAINHFYSTFSRQVKGLEKESANKILRKIRNFLKTYENSSKTKALDLVEYEIGELEHIFGLLVLSNFVGLPSPPMNITMDLLPDMEKHLLHLISKIDTAENPLSDLASILNIT